MSDNQGPAEPTGDAYEADAAFPEQEEPEVRRRRQFTVKGVAIAGARTVGLLVAAGVAIVAILGATLLPLPTLGSDPASRVITPVPTAQQLVCAGSVLRLSDESGAGATTSSALGQPRVDSAASEGAASRTPLETSDASTGGTAAAPQIISTPPTAADATNRVLVSGAQSQQLADGDFVGLAASDCDVANGDSWLVGGATTTGRTTLLSLANPSEVPATVDLELFGESGPIAAPGTRGIIVPANGQRVLSLAGFQPDIVSPVVHVTSKGGQVSATLQEAIVRGLQPGGIDIVPSVPALSTSTVIPGVVMTYLGAVQALRGGGPAFDDTETVLRVFAPGEGSVSLAVNLTPEDGAQTAVSFELAVDAGRVTDVPIEQLATGNYTVSITSSSPVAAAARLTSATSGGSDLAWFTAASPLGDRAQFTAASAGAPVLHVANPGRAAATVTLTPIDGAPVTVAVGPGASTLVPLGPGVSYDLSGTSGLSASVSLTAGGTIAGYTVHPPGVASAPLRVYP